MLFSFSNAKIRTDSKILYLLFGVLLTYGSSYFPDIASTIGIDGTTISSMITVSSLNGMLFGPFWGSLVSAIGMLLRELSLPGYLSRGPFELISFFLMFVCSTVSGFAVNRQYKLVTGIFITLLLIWLVSDVGRQAYLFPWFHLVVLVSFLYFNKLNLDHTNGKITVFIWLFFAAILGVLSNHLAGSITYAYVYDLSASTFNSVIFIYPVERIVLSLGAAFVAFVFMFIFKEIALSSDSIDIDLIEKKNSDMMDYISTDVWEIMNEEKFKK
jgi:hypothetical protein